MFFLPKVLFFKFSFHNLGQQKTELCKVLTSFKKCAAVLVLQLITLKNSLMCLATSALTYRRFCYCRPVLGTYNEIAHQTKL